MESSAALRSLNQTVGSVVSSHYILEKSNRVHLHCGSWAASGNSCVSGLKFGGNRNLTALLSAKASETSATSKTDDATNTCTQGSKEKKDLQRITFPNDVEALIHEVCDNTQIAELKLKVGDFEMRLKRNTVETMAPAPLSDISPTTAPPIPSEPMNGSASDAPSPTQAKSSADKASPFMNTSFGKSSKLAALEASGSNNYVIVSSPTVGIFQRAGRAKGKKQPPSCKEGDLVKEGQVIGYLNQFGTELPVKSDVTGEVLKLLCDDGDAVGYADPLVAILPSFHDINIK